MSDNETEEKKKSADQEAHGEEEKPEAGEGQATPESAEEVEFISVQKEEEVQSPGLKLKTAETQAEETKGLKSKLKKKEAEIRTLKKEIEQLKDKYLRALAEMDNLRKRQEREKVEFRNYALSEFLKEFLVILDNFERALRCCDQTDGKTFREGVEMIYRLTLDLLMKKGVVPIEVKDKRFDPARHQAVLTEESEDIEEPQVAEELQRGYLHHERLLRPTMVKVLIPKKKVES